MGRLIDESNVVKMIDKHTNDDMTLDDDITCILENIPTAYDVDKVVEQLEDYPHGDYINVVTMGDIIGIVKKGGK